MEAPGRTTRPPGARPPNAIGGDAVEGPSSTSPAAEISSATCAAHAHGMTIGELARLYNASSRSAAGWTSRKWRAGRARLYFRRRPDSRGSNPSAEHASSRRRSPMPGLGRAQRGESLGRPRHEKPFVWFGAPWLDGAKVCAELAGRKLPGVRWKPVTFTPRSSPACPSIPTPTRSAAESSRRSPIGPRFGPVTAALHVLDVLIAPHPKEFSFGGPADDRRKSIEDDLKSGKSPADIEKAWQRSSTLLSRGKRTCSLSGSKPFARKSLKLSALEFCASMHKIRLARARQSDSAARRRSDIPSRRSAPI